VQRELVWRPPAYYTSDWASARRSVERIAELEPEVLATGHGHTMRGAAMRQQLGHLARNFEHFKPPRGRYIDAPALADERGVISVPPQHDTGRAAVAIGVAAAVAGATLMAAARARHSSRPGEADLS
jgi:hypothetical protein